MTYEEAIERARDIVWGPDAILIVASLLMAQRDKE